MSETISIYTDGACSGNPGPGGYGIVMLYKGHRKEISAGYKYTTNNRMELLSVIVALDSIKTEGMNVVVYSDSKYVVDAIEKGWLKGWIMKNFAKIKNPDLWVKMVRAMKRHKVKFVWVKGHASNVENNRCDELAVAATKSKPLIEDTEFERLKSSGMYEE
ncbi:MAG: ribonuclease HI [Bacteroidia bacterium]|nr:ribonuclease HI [Bacteroidia bacterium]